MVSGHKSKRQKMDFNFVGTQVKIAKDGFQLCPDTSQNRKRWIYLSSMYLRTYVRTQMCTYVCRDGLQFTKYHMFYLRKMNMTHDMILQSSQP